MPSTRRITVLQYPVLALLAALVLVGLLSFAQPEPVAFDDSLRHMAMARLLWANGIFSVPGWSSFFYQGLLSGLHTDPWYLFDVLLIPFTALPTAAAIKIYTLLEFLALGLSFLLLLRRFGASKEAMTVLVLLLVLGNDSFLFRSLLGRPFLLITALALLALWAVLEDKPVLLGLVLLCSTLLSQLFVFPLFFAGVGVLWLLGIRKRREASRVVLAAVLGVGAGFLIHPYPIEYVAYLLTVFLRIPFLKKDLRLGTEMRFADPGAYLPVMIVLGMISLLGFYLWREGALSPRRIARGGLTLVAVLAAMFFPVFVAWKRALDLLWPLLLLTLGALVAQRPGSVENLGALAFKRGAFRRAGLLLLMLFGSLQLFSVIRDIQSSVPLAAFALPPSVPAGTHVFNMDWDRFAPYVSQRPDVVFATGIDPSYTYLVDPVSYALLGYQNASWNEIAPLSVRTVDAWLSLLHSVSPRAEYLVLRRDFHPRFIRLLAKAKGARLVTITSQMAVYQILRPGTASPR